MSTFAKTSRLTLRPYDPSRGDDTSVVEIFYSFDNMLFGTRDIAPVRPRDRAGIVESINSSLFFAVIEVGYSVDPSLAAVAGLVMLQQVGSPRNRKASLAISFLPDHWGKGYGTEIMQWLLEHAFNHLALHRMSLDVLATNERAIAMYKKVYVKTWVVVKRLTAADDRVAAALWKRVASGKSFGSTGSGSMASLWAASSKTGSLFARKSKYATSLN